MFLFIIKRIMLSTNQEIFSQYSVHQNKIRSNRKEQYYNMGAAGAAKDFSLSNMYSVKID